LSPAVDIYETDNEVILKAELPGLTRKTSYQVENNTLVLRGERRFEKEAKRENFHRIERAYGAFADPSRCLPRLTRKDRADYKDGILKVVMPKAKRSN
jgi:HSP20 family protein